MTLCVRQWQWTLLSLVADRHILHCCCRLCWNPPFRCYLWCYYFVFPYWSYFRWTTYFLWIDIGCVSILLFDLPVILSLENVAPKIVSINLAPAVLVVFADTIYMPVSKPIFADSNSKNFPRRKWWDRALTHKSQKSSQESLGCENLIFVSWSRRISSVENIKWAYFRKYWNLKQPNETPARIEASKWEMRTFRTNNFEKWWRHFTH